MKSRISGKMIVLGCLAAVLLCAGCGTSRTERGGMAEGAHPSAVRAAAPDTVPAAARAASPAAVPDLARTSAPNAAQADKPAAAPTAAPIDRSDASLAGKPAAVPSASPAAASTRSPQASLTAFPTDFPTDEPTKTQSAAPARARKAAPSAVPADKPAAVQAASPTAVPAGVPAVVPSAAPADTPARARASAPSAAPAYKPASVPASVPVAAPASVPSAPAAAPTPSAAAGKRAGHRSAANAAGPAAVKKSTSPAPTGGTGSHAAGAALPGEAQLDAPKTKNLQTPVPGKEPIRILFVGDSLMCGIGPAMEKQLKRKFGSGYGFYQAGKVSSGLTNPKFYNWPVQLRGFMSTYKPQVVLICIGTNDAQATRHEGRSLGFWTGKWQEVYAQRIVELSNVAIGGGALVGWISMPRMWPQKLHDNTLKIRELVAKTCAANGISYLDEWDVLPDRSTRAKDGIHCTWKGYGLLAARAFEWLCPLMEEYGYVLPEPLPAPVKPEKRKKSGSNGAKSPVQAARTAARSG